MKNYLQVYRILPNILDAVQYFEQVYENGNAAENIGLIQDINQATDHASKELKASQIHASYPYLLTENVFLDARQKEQGKTSLEKVKNWIIETDKLLSQMLELCKPPTEELVIDIKYKQMFAAISDMGEEKLYKRLVGKYRELSSPSKKRIENYLAKYSFWGSLDEKKEDFTLYRNRAQALYAHQADFLWLYDRLGDHRSRYVLYAYVSNWYHFDFIALKNVRETMFYDYFDPDIVQCGPNEVFVDLGAYIGDTVSQFVNTYTTQYKRIYCYEITPDTVETLKDNLATFKNIVIRQKGASDKKETLYMAAGPDTSANQLLNKGQIPIETVAIDEDIQEPVTFIKMDIEGFEQKALLGCKNHIVNDKPKLAISVYHNNEDIWKIPRMVDEICPGYRFYLRYHGGDLFPSEMSFLAIYPDE